jgi:hypothetical protein
MWVSIEDVGCELDELRAINWLRENKERTIENSEVFGCSKDERNGRKCCGLYALLYMLPPQRCDFMPFSHIRCSYQTRKTSVISRQS